MKSFVASTDLQVYLMRNEKARPAYEFARYGLHREVSVAQRGQSLHCPPHALSGGHILNNYFIQYTLYVMYCTFIIYYHKHIMYYDIYAFNCPELESENVVANLPLQLRDNRF